MQEAPVNKRVFWIMAAIGIAVMGFGVMGLFHSADRTNPGQWVRWFVGAALVHDFVVAPVVFAVALATRKVMPVWAAGVVNGALIATAVLAAMTYPFLRGYGENPANPSILPNNYALNLALVLGLVWVVTAIALVKTRLSLKETDPRTGPSASAG